MIYLAERGYSGLYILPTDAWRSTFVPNRIDRCFSETKFYRDSNQFTTSKDSDSRIMKTIHGRNWKFVGSVARNNFYEFPAQALIIDEYDLCDHSNLIYSLDRLGAAENPQIRMFGNPSIQGTGIDKVFDDSDAKIWMIRCEHCNEWQPLDWFANFVEQKDNGSWLLRDTSFDSDGEGDALPLCRKCSKPIDRLSSGLWVAEHPDSVTVSGYAISKLFADGRKMPVVNNLFEAWISAQGNPTSLQRFYNNILGVAYTAEGSRFTEALFESICDPDFNPIAYMSCNDPLVMGVDTGGDLHYHIVQITNGKEHTITAGHVRQGDYNTLDLICKEFRVFHGVIDAQGDLNSTRKFVQSHPGWYMCRYIPSSEDLKKDMSVDYKSRTVSVNRTESIDDMYAAHMEKKIIYSKGWRSLDNGDFLKHMLAPTRIYLDPPPSSIGAPGRYVWDEGSKADHHFHARNYCHIAARISGGVGEGVHIL